MKPSPLHVIPAPKRKPVSRERIKTAVRLFRSEFAPRALRRRNATAWLVAVEKLGARWVYANTVKLERKAK